MSTADAPDVALADRAELREWLEQNADRSGGVWIVYEKGDGRRLHYDDIVEEALCFGWIDSLPRRLDERHSKLYLAPRKPKSGWSKKNKDRVELLASQGLLTERGLAVIERAKLDGSWAALDEVETLHEPGDLAEALDAVPAARAEWDSFPRSAKRAILEWIAGAKRAGTRKNRIDETVNEAAVGRRANQWRQPKRSTP